MSRLLIRRDRPTAPTTEPRGWSENQVATQAVATRWPDTPPSRPSPRDIAAAGTSAPKTSLGDLRPPRQVLARLTAEELGPPVRRRPVLPVTRHDSET